MSERQSGDAVGENYKSARFVSQENVYNDPVALHNAMHLHFPK